MQGRTSCEKYLDACNVESAAQLQTDFNILSAVFFGEGDATQSWVSTAIKKYQQRKQTKKHQQSSGAVMTVHGVYSSYLLKREE